MSGEVEASQVTLRFASGSPRTFVVAGPADRIQAQLDKAAAGSLRASMTDARTQHRFTMELHEVETYSVKSFKL